jgi:hypothetical protein
MKIMQLEQELNDKERRLRSKCYSALSVKLNIQVHCLVFGVRVCVAISGGSEQLGTEIALDQNSLKRV